MRFELKEILHRLVNVNPRPEMHGQDKKPAADLKLSCMLPNTELAQLHPMLKGLLFEKASNQADLVSDADPEYAPTKRFPQLGSPLKWEGEMVGAVLTVHQGISPRSDLVLDGCIINKFALEPLEGGSVAVTYQVQFHPEEKEIGKLCMLAGQDVKVSLTPPTETAEA